MTDLRMAADSTWEPPVLELGPESTAHICHLLATDLRRWTPARRTRLDKAEMLALLMFLADHLPAERRPAIPRLEPEEEPLRPAV